MLCYDQYGVGISDTYVRSVRVDWCSSGVKGSSCRRESVEGAVGEANYETNAVITRLLKVTKRIESASIVVELAIGDRDTAKPCSNRCFVVLVEAVVLDERTPIATCGPT